MVAKKTTTKSHLVSVQGVKQTTFKEVQYPHGAVIGTGEQVVARGVEGQRVYRAGVFCVAFMGLCVVMGVIGVYEGLAGCSEWIIEV